MGKNPNQFVNSFFGEVSFTQPIGFVDEKDLAESFLEELLGFWTRLTDVLTD